MNYRHSHTKRLLLAAGLAAAVFATALGGSTAGADPAKPAPSRTPTPPPTNTGIIPPDLANRRISVGTVQVVGTEATLAFFTAQPAAATVAYKPASGAGAGGQSPAQGYATDHQRTLTGLEANTSYAVTITARTQSGETLSAQTSFTTTPLINGPTVQAQGTEATVRFTTAEPAIVIINYSPGVGSPASVRPGTQSSQDYATTHEHKLTGLASNTTYNVNITAQTRAGTGHTATTSFTTLKKRVAIVLESIDIKDDGDGLLSGDGEPVWFVRPGGDTVTWTNSYYDGAVCYPSENALCTFGKYGEGRFTPRTAEGNALMFVFVEEHFDRFPSTISLKTWAKEDDAVGGAWLVECLKGGCPVGDAADVREWRVPQGVESATQTITLRGDDPGTGFASVLTFRIELTHHNVPYFKQRPNGWWDNW